MECLELLMTRMRKVNGIPEISGMTRMRRIFGNGMTIIPIMSGMLRMQ